MSVVCQIDQSVHEDIKALHIYLRKFRIKQEAYYHEYHKRYNVVTGKLIPYKSYDQYFSQDLESKTELKNWIKEQPEEAKKWAIDWLKKRREEKMLTYAPSQTELRTLLCPSMPYYNSIGGYYNITRKLGYQDRYNDEPLKFDIKIDRIIQDTREQTPLRLSIGTIVKKLDYGDYATMWNEEFKNNIYIERKSLNDFAGTMSKGNARFRRELERATKKGHYIVMLVEAKITDAQALEFLPQTRHIRASSAFVLKQMRDLLVDFPFSFQVLFVDGRIEAAQKLVKIFELGEQVKTTDLQYAYEEGKL